MIDFGTKTDGYFGAPSAALAKSRVGQLPIDTRRQAAVTPSTPGMVMLRRSPDSKCWLARFIGVKHFPANELPAPIPCDSPLPAVLEWLTTVKHAQGAWILIVP